MPTSLRDLLTGAIPGNVLNQIPLGDANDPQFNRFTYNVFGSLGPSPGVNTGMPTIFAGPYGGSFGGGQQGQQGVQQQAPGLRAAPVSPSYGRSLFSPGESLHAPYSMPQATTQPFGGGFGGGGMPRQSMTAAPVSPSYGRNLFSPGETMDRPYGMGSSPLMSRMLSWKM